MESKLEQSGWGFYTCRDYILYLFACPSEPGEVLSTWWTVNASLFNKQGLKKIIEILLEVLIEDILYLLHLTPKT